MSKVSLLYGGEEGLPRVGVRRRLNQYIISPWDSGLYGPRLDDVNFVLSSLSLLTCTLTPTAVLPTPSTLRLVPFLR